MQFSSILFALVAIATVSVAALPQAESSSQGSCSTGTAQCCESVHDGADAQSLASLIGLNDVVGQVGLNCVSLKSLVWGFNSQNLVLMDLISQDESLTDV